MSQKESYFSTITAYSYNEYINSQLKLISNSLYFSITYFDEETYNIIEALKKTFVKLPSTLSANSTEKEALALNLVQYKELVESKYRVLSAYQRELTHVLTASGQKFTSSTEYLESIGIEDADNIDFDYDRLLDDCTNYVFKDKDSTSTQKRAYTLLPYIPIKLTKANYLDYCKKSIMHIDTNDSAENTLHLTSILFQIFDGSLCPNYNLDFADLVDSINAIGDLDNATDLFEEANMLNETFETLISLLEDIYKVICTLSNLLLFDKLDFTDLTELHMSFSDSYYSLKSIYTDCTEEDLLLESLIQRVEDVSKELEKELNEAKREGQLNPLFNLMLTYLDMSPNSLFGFSTSKEISGNPEIVSIIDNFISSIDTKLSSYSNEDRKIRMQYFISNIPFMMSKTTFKTYIQKGLSNFKTAHNGILVALQLSNILEQSGHFPQQKEIPAQEDYSDLEDEAARFLREFDK